MDLTYITLEEAAVYEGMKYQGMASRVNRNPDEYDLKTQPREGGGRPQVLVSVASLSPKARRAYKAAQAVNQEENPASGEEIPPWYVEADLNSYIESNKRKFYEAVELANQLQCFIDYDEREKTTYASEFAASLGISQRTLYRYVGNIMEAQAWARRLEQKDGHSRDYFKVLSLCRKPRVKDNFPSLPEEQKAYIAAVWFSRSFCQNLGTREMLYDALKAEAKRQGWECPSMRTVGRYISYLMEQRGARSAQYLAANGTREWKNKMMLKTKRDSTALKVMEYVVGDEHTFDIWVQYTAPNGKIKAVRPKLTAWEDMRSRAIIGDVISIDANSQTLKESLVKMIYSEIGGVPKVLHIDNGKDYTAETMTGQSRKERRIEFDFDAETVGFYQSIGVQEVGRSLPYQAWDKPIERFFSTVCNKFSRWFASYTGTLTGSKTYAKRHKDIDGMLERGELYTMEEFFELWTQWKQEYMQTEHRALKSAGEKWRTPLEVFQNAERYEKAAPPREYAALLLMQSATARVTNQGINRFGTLYTHYELAFYIGQTVGIKWDLDDVTKLYVFDIKNGKKVCEAESAELLQYYGHVSQDALEKHLRNQKRQQKETQEFLDAVRKGYTELVDEGRKTATVGGLDLALKPERKQKVVSLPVDKEYRKGRKYKKAEENEFLQSKGNEALERLRAMQG